jgi:serine/threonine-protein kinase
VLALVITGIPVRHESVRTSNPAIRDPEFRNLIEVGVPPEIAATSDVGVGIIFFLALFGAGALLFARGSGSREALFVSFAMILFGASWSGLLSVHRTTGPPFAQSPVGLIATILFFLQTSTTFTAFFWLPGGRFVYRWTAWLMAFTTGIVGALYFFVSYPLSHDLVNIIALPVDVLAIWNQASHYRRADLPTRERIKWIAIGFGAGITGFLIGQTANLVLSNQPGLAPRVVMLLAHLLDRLCQIALLGCFAFAIVRYRIWQVDLVINRSIVYGTVTVLLGLIFAAGGLVLQRLFGENHTSLAFAVSTVGTAFLFNPARKRAQHVIDRRLYGFRFDLNELHRAQEVPLVAPVAARSGHTIADYRIIGLLGKGGMGEVYRGERDGRIVAIKVMPEELATRDLGKWFERESQALAALDHPNIVRLHEAGEINGRRFLILDFIEGRELNLIIKERGRLRLDEVRSLLGGLGDALDYAHARGLVHRDIKPSNIMIRHRNSETPEAILMDFGIAKSAEALTARTSTGAIGTISYMAPEQIRAAAVIDHRADIYALGVTVYEMLTGNLPFTGSSAQVLFAHLQDQPPDPRQFAPELPMHVTGSVLRCLEKRPEDRFQSVGEFVSAFSRA